MHPTQPLQTSALTTASLIVLAIFVYLLSQDQMRALLFLIALAMGVTLLHASFGFTGAYRKLLTQRDMTGVSAQLIMLAVSILLFTPILAQGSVFGHGVVGSIAPVSISMALGAFMFGIGMQFGNGCASGSLFTAGGGNVRMWLVLVFFCLGAFWGSLDLAWWQTLPSLGPISLTKELGWQISVPLQLGLLGAIYLGLKLNGWQSGPITGGLSWQALLRGPWPLIYAAIALAVLNWLTLLIAGHAWSITWAFSLWAAKGAVLMGWDPTSSDFWSGGFQQAALARSIFSDTTSVMNIGILAGATLAASAAGTYGKRLPMELRPIIASAIGGLMMGYGARLSYGCNIGAFFSGVASASLHGWVWILCALPGNAVGIALRRPFRLVTT